MTTNYCQQIVSADMLTNSIRQRIGDYDIQINTVPARPISGQDTHINIRISSVSNIPVTDTPMVIRISDGKHQLFETNPVFLSSGHYTYNYKFDRAGLFLVSVDILDNMQNLNPSDPNGTLNFDFPIRISEPFLAEIDSLIITITVIGTVTGAIIILILFRKYKYSKKVI
jgi:hypothetical protein